MEFSNRISSDTLIYNILSDSDDPILARHLITFPTPSDSESDIDSISIAHVSNEYDRQTNDSDHFLATVELTIKNRNTDYGLANEAINLCIKHIKKVLRSNDEIKKRQLRILSSNTTYDETDVLNRNLILQLYEMDFYDIEEKNIDDLDILFSGVEVNV
jgi:hypothetical protein